MPQDAIRVGVNKATLVFERAAGRHQWCERRRRCFVVSLRRSLPPCIVVDHLGSNELSWLERLGGVHDADLDRAEYHLC